MYICLMDVYKYIYWSRWDGKGGLGLVSQTWSGEQCWGL